jgi:ferrous iron transport protein B
MWARAWQYCKKAGTIILAVGIILWALTAYPKKEVFEKDYDAERGAADVAAAETAKSIGEELGLPGEGLADYARALQLKEGFEKEYWEHEPGYAEGERAYEAAVAAAGQGGGEHLAAFLETLAALDDAEAAFAEATEELGEDDPGYLLAARERDEILGALEKTDAALFAAAERFRDEVVGARAESLARIDAEEHGESMTYAYAGRLGKAIEPVIRPMGFDWTIGTALVGAISAKEVFVAQMGIVHSVGEADEESEPLRETLRRNYSTLQAICIILFCLLSAPCMATFAVARREMNSTVWAAAQFIGLTATAYVVTCAAWRIGTALGY